MNPVSQITNMPRIPTPALIGPSMLVDGPDSPPHYLAPLIICGLNDDMPLVLTLVVNAADSTDWGLMAPPTGVPVTASQLVDYYGSGEKRDVDFLVASIDGLALIAHAAAQVLPTATHTAPEALQ